MVKWYEAVAGMALRNQEIDQVKLGREISGALRLNVVIDENGAQLGVVADQFIYLVGDNKEWLQAVGLGVLESDGPK